jgi:hypothetical protein
MDIRYPWDVRIVGGNERLSVITKKKVTVSADDENERHCQ